MEIPLVETTTWKGDCCSCEKTVELSCNEAFPHFTSFPANLRSIYRSCPHCGYGKDEPGGIYKKVQLFLSAK